MACQFGCGAKGKLAILVNNGMDCNARNVKDGNLISGLRLSDPRFRLQRLVLYRKPGGLRDIGKLGPGSCAKSAARGTGIFIAALRRPPLRRAA